MVVERGVGEGGAEGELAMMFWRPGKWKFGFASIIVRFGKSDGVVKESERWNEWD